MSNFKIQLVKSILIEDRKNDITANKNAATEKNS
jgi:hypothetical protein